MIPPSEAVLSPPQNRSPDMEGRSASWFLFQVMEWAPQIADFHNEDQSMYLGMSRLDLFYLTEMLVLIVVSVAILALIIFPLIDRALEATQTALLSIQELAEGPPPPPPLVLRARLRKIKTGMIFLSGLAVLAGHSDFIGYLFSKFQF